MKFEQIMTKYPKQMNRILLRNFEELDCILLVNNKTEHYEIIKSDEAWDVYLKKCSDRTELFANLFCQTKSVDAGIDQGYQMFWDKTVFEKERFESEIHLSLGENERLYRLSMRKISEEESVVAFRRLERFSENGDLNSEKIDALQNNYLFSMIVDLKKDLCLNSNVAELSMQNRNYANLSYSDWRLRVSTVVMESEKDNFLRVSSPEHIINQLEQRPSFHIVLRMRNLSGKYVWSRLAFARTRDFSRNNPRFIYTVEDIEEEMKELLSQDSVVNAVAEQNEKLMEATKARTKLFSNMSHEIRTPLNSILGLNEVILRDSTEPEIQRYAKDIRNSGKYMLGLINDILDSSKIEAGKMEIVEVEYAPEEMLNEIGTMISAQVLEKDLGFLVDISPELPKRLYGDVVRVTQIIMNLLTNAVKYTTEGNVFFGIEGITEKSGEFALKVTVKDTGIGIIEEDLDKLTSAYKRVGLGFAQKIEGTGLGLYIVTSLLEQMGGTLSVESVYQKGSTFSFVLPQKVVNIEAAVEKDEKSFDASEKRILVIDDMPMNLRVVSALLKPYGARVDLANGGKTGLMMMQKNQYDLVFIDHMMPDLDGIETLHKMRDLGGEYAKVPAVALTSNAQSGAKEYYLKEGFNEYLDKPIVTAKLESVIRNYLTRV